jgi:hypothetical protein
VAKRKSRSAAAKKAARTRKRHQAERSAIARKAARKSVRCRKARTAKSRKRNCAPKARRRSAPRRSRRKTSGKRKNPKRVRAGRKAARIRKAKLRTYAPGDYGESPRRKRRRRSRKARESVAAAPRRRRRKARRHARRRTTGRRRHHVRAINPIAGAGEFGAALGGIILGVTAAVLGDRYAAGHALTAGATAGSYTDQPAAGQLYNSNASLAPIWSSWKRLVVAGANLVVPFGASMAAKRHPKTQTMFQTWFFGALAVTLGKVTLDVLPKVLGTKAVGARLLAPEIDAQNARLAVGTTTTLPGYALTAGGTGPTPPAAAAGGTMLGSPRQTLGGTTSPEGGPNNYPGYAAPQSIAPSTPIDTSLPTANSEIDGSAGCGPDADPDEDEWDRWRGYRNSTHSQPNASPTT